MIPLTPGQIRPRSCRRQIVLDHGLGGLYQVQYTTNLNQGQWVNFGGTIAGTNGDVLISDFITNAQRFYRVVLLP